MLKFFSYLRINDFVYFACYRGEIIIFYRIHNQLPQSLEDKENIMIFPNFIDE